MISVLSLKIYHTFENVFCAANPKPIYSVILMGNIWTLQSALSFIQGNTAQKASSLFTKALNNYQITCFLTIKRKLKPNVCLMSIFTEGRFVWALTAVYSAAEWLMLQMICTVNIKLFCVLFSVKSTATDCRCVRLLPIFHLLESRALCWEAIWLWNIIAKMVRTLLSLPIKTYDVTLHCPCIKPHIWCW